MANERTYAGGRLPGFVPLVQSGNDFVPMPATMPVASGLAIPEHDYIALTYTGSDLTGVVYKTGGAGGTTVTTLTLAYSGGNLASVTKS